jgi:outer membrane biosynthesis protein TonB
MGEFMSKFKSNEEYFAFSKRLVVIPTADIKKLLLKHKIYIPLYVHTFLLKETIRQKVFEDNLYNTYTDEMKFRLRGYDSYSAFPLEKLIEKYNLDFELARYKELLFDFLFVNRDIFKYRNSFISDLEQLQHNYTVDLEVMQYSDFYALLKEVFFQEEGYLDGLKLTEWTEELLASYTLGDLKELGKKYDVTIPRRINKAKLIQILTAKFNLTEDEAKLLSEKSVLDLEIYAKEKGFKISIDLKKRDMIEYIEFSLGMYHKTPHVDEYAYDIPLATKEEAAIMDIEEEAEPVRVKEVVKKPEPIIQVPIEEEVEPEPVVEILEEQKPEPIIEEPVVEEEIIEEIEDEPQPEPVQELVEEESIIAEPASIVEEIKEVVTPVKEEKKQEQPKFVTEQSKKASKQPFKQDESLLSVEEKELLDEKINQIIKKYYKKRRRRRITWTIIITLLVVIIGFVGYSYIYYNANGALPFNIPVFW